MVRPVHAGFPCNWVGDLRDSRSRLDRKYIQPGANTFSVNGLDQRPLIYNFTARGIDEVSAFLHPFKEVWTDQHSCVGLQSDMDADDVSFAGHSERRIHPDYAQLRRLFLSQASAPGDHRHPKGSGPWNHLLGDTTQAH